MKTFILGGARSGKSRLAERLAATGGLPVTYIATAQAADQEMRDRIAVHRTRRPANWTLVEEPLALATALRSHARQGHCVLVDCLTLWLTQLLCLDDEARFQTERAALISTLPILPGQIILVSNESGMGIVPTGALSRRYCDEAGWLHQDIARLCDSVIWTVAGLPHILKGESLCLHH